MKEIERITQTACNKNTTVDTARNYNEIIFQWKNFMSSNNMLEPRLSNKENFDRVGRNKLESLIRWEILIRL